MPIIQLYKDKYDGRFMDFYIEMKEMAPYIMN